jgi:uncharacterized protein YndB with AHSA1/START domain
MQEWQLNSVVEVFIDASVERLWAALTEAADTEQYFMRARVTVGDVGQAYRLERDDGWEVDGTVLAKEPPYRLRVTWRIKTPPDLVMPNCEVEYLIDPTLIPEAKSTTKLTVNSYVDGPVPAVLKCKPHGVGDDHAKSERISRLTFVTARNLPTGEPVE